MLRRRCVSSLLAALALIPVSVVSPAVRAQQLPTLGGSVSLPDGLPAAGAKVTVSASDALPSEGWTSPLVLAETVTDDHGRFAVDVVPSEVTVRFLRPSGVLNTRIEALAYGTDDVHVAVWHVPLTLVGSGFAPADPVALTAAAAGSPPECDSPTGGTLREVAREAKLTRIGELHSWDNMWTSFHYKFTAITKLSTGFSADGQNWSASGARKVDNDKGGANIQTEAERGRFGRVQRNTMSYVKVATCYSGALTPYPNGLPRQGHYEIIADKADAGLQNGTEPGDDVSRWDGPAEYLANWAKARHFNGAGYHEKVTSKTITYEGAANAFGFSVSAESVYDNNLKMTWRFGEQFGKATDLHTPYHLWGHERNVVDSQNIYAYSGPEPVIVDPPYQMAEAVPPYLPSGWCCGYAARWNVTVAKDPDRALTLDFKPYSSDPLHPNYWPTTVTVPQGSGMFTTELYTERWSWWHILWPGQHPSAKPWTAEAKIRETGVTATAVWDSPA